MILKLDHVKDKYKDEDRDNIINDLFEALKEIEKADKVILIEQNVTGQLGRLIREKTGIKNVLLCQYCSTFAC